MTLIACVAHHSRLEMSAVNQADVTFIDHGSRGSLWNHRRALEWAAGQSERVWVIEDDAILSDGFRDRADLWADRFPHDLISGYLGTGRPPQWQPTVRREMARADQLGLDYIELPALIHGVCYSLPVGASLDIRTDRREAADYVIGRAWGKRVVYTLPSLADHADTTSVEDHPDAQPRVESRRAWRFVDDQGVDE